MKISLNNVSKVVYNGIEVTQVKTKDIVVWPLAGVVEIRAEIKYLDGTFENVSFATTQEMNDYVSPNKNTVEEIKIIRSEDAAIAETGGEGNLNGMLQSSTSLRILDVTECSTTNLACSSLLSGNLETTQKRIAKNQEEVDKWNSLVLVKGFATPEIHANWLWETNSYQHPAIIVKYIGSDVENVRIPSNEELGDCGTITIGSITDTSNTVFADIKDTVRTIDVTGSLIKVGKYSFAGCTKLETFDLSKIFQIEEGTFDGCINLEGTFTNVKDYIGEYAFRNCAKIKEIALEDEIYGSTPAKSAFEGTNLILRVPQPRLFSEFVREHGMLDVLNGRIMALDRPDIYVWDLSKVGTIVDFSKFAPGLYSVSRWYKEEKGVGYEEALIGLGKSGTKVPQNGIVSQIGSAPCSVAPVPGEHGSATFIYVSATGEPIVAGNKYSSYSSGGQAELRSSTLFDRQWTTTSSLDTYFIFQALQQ